MTSTTEAFHQLTTESKIPVYLPPKTLQLVKKQFELNDENIDNFVALVLERAVNDHNIEQQSTNVFTEAEVKELEDDLRGLGYI